MVYKRQPLMVMDLRSPSKDFIRKNSICTLRGFDVYDRKIPSYSSCTVT